MNVPGMTSPSKSNLTSRITAAALAVLALCAVIALTIFLVPGLWARIQIQGKDAVRGTRERDQVIADARVIVQAMNMYAQDNDGLYPPPGNKSYEAWRKVSDVYCLSPNAFKPVGGQQDAFGFAFRPSYKNSKAVLPLGEFEVGYKLGISGRAVMYADGHVVWVPGDFGHVPVN